MERTRSFPIVPFLATLPIAVGIVVVMPKLVRPSQVNRGPSRIAGPD